MQTEVEELLGFEIREDDVEPLHITCIICEVTEPDVCLCGVYDPVSKVWGREYLNCIVCWDLWEQGECTRGHTLRAGDRSGT